MSQSRFGRSGEEINSLPLTGLEHRIIQVIFRLTVDFSWEFLTFHLYGLQNPLDFMIITFNGISNILTTIATLRNVNGIRRNKQGVARSSVFYAASPKKCSFTAYYTGGIFFNLLLEFCKNSCISPLIKVPQCNILPK